MLLTVTQLLVLFTREWLEYISIKADDIRSTQYCPIFQSWPLCCAWVEVLCAGVSESSRTESIMKYMLTTINTRKATKRVKAPKQTSMTHKIAIQLHLVAESCTICSSRSRRPVRKLSDTPSYFHISDLLYLVHDIQCLQHQLSVEVSSLKRDTRNEHFLEQNRK
jgi:hypothetical protein